MTALATPPAFDRPERRFSVDEYLRMVSVGILTDRDKVELLEGRIVEKMPPNPPHEATLQRVFSLLLKLCPPDWMVRAQSTLRCATSAPEPDVMMLRGPIDRYDQAHPGAADALLVVEIADSSLRDDRHAKAALYAGAAIAVYWLINLGTAASRSSPIPPAPALSPPTAPATITPKLTPSPSSSPAEPPSNSPSKTCFRQRSDNARPLRNPRNLRLPITVWQHPAPRANSRSHANQPNKTPRQGVGQFLISPRYHTAGRVRRRLCGIRGRRGGGRRIIFL
jgi:Uma2 family endonuclease